MRIGVDLLWVRPGRCGGTESYIRNLLSGFGQFTPENEYVLFLAEDNAESFEGFSRYGNMRLQTCRVRCENQAKRILWENAHLYRLAKKEGTDAMFIPVYSKPLTFGSRIPYVCVIHDLQARHYPQYFSVTRRMFLRFMWWYACKTAARIVTVSDFCREDIRSAYPFAAHKLKTIYVPIVTREIAKEELQGAWERMSEKFGIEKEGYYYCVSAMLPHKNLVTVLRVMSELKKSGSRVKLVLSGVGGQNRAFDRAVEELDIGDLVIQTGFVSDAERDCLYENCRVFLFPSIFEGFGMPPVEAMRRGKNVVMTKKSCLMEISEGKAVYVENPTDVGEWIRKIEQAEKREFQRVAFEKYDLVHVTDCYRRIFDGLTNGVGLDGCKQ